MLGVPLVGGVFGVRKASSQCIILALLPILPRYLVMMFMSALCTAVIPEMEFKRYVDLWSTSRKRKTKLIKMTMTITADKEERLEMATKQLFDESTKKPKTSTELKQFFKSAGCSKNTKLTGQPGIDAALDKLVQCDITHMNHAKMDMAMASFFHESNIPFNAVGSSSFKLMLNYARLVGKDYKPPSREALATTMLDVNHKNCVQHNKEVLCREAKFGLSWLSDGVF